MFNKKIIKILFMLFMKILPQSFISSQLRKPSGFIGKYIMCKLLEYNNMPMINLMYKQYIPNKKDIILDIGFGPGQFFPLLINDRLTNIHGIDFSKDAVALCCKKFKKNIKSGNLTLNQASVEKIPYETNFFNTVFTANTVYFWPDALSNIKEIYRVIKTGGKFIMGFSPREQLERIGVDLNIFTGYSIEETSDILKSAGFKNIQLHTEPMGEYTLYVITGEK